MKKHYLILYIILSPFFLAAQNDSYQKVFSEPYIYSFGTVVDDNDNISLLLSDDPSSFDIFYVEHFNPEAIAHETKVIQSDGNLHDFKPLTPWVETELHSEQELICKYWSTGSGHALFYINFETGDYWDVGLALLTQTDNTNLIATSVDGEGSTYLYSSWNNEPAFSRFKIDNTGTVTEFIKYNFDLPAQDLLCIESIYNQTTFSSLSISHLPSSGTILCNTDTIGTVLQSRLFEDVFLYEIISDGNGGYFTIGKTTLINDVSGNEQDLVLIKLDAQLNVVWSKVFYADYFNYKRATLNLLPDGSLVMAYSTSGAFPVILSKLNPNGDLIWEKGYPLFEPEIDITSDGSLILTSRQNFDNSGNLFSQIVLTKTDTLGNIANCEIFPTCIKMTEIALTSFDVSSGQINFIPFQVPSYPLTLSETTLQSEFSCDIPAAPSPLFELTDTLCVNTHVELTDLPNTYAHGIEWKISGTDIDSTWQDSTSFAFSFNESGDYLVEQSVWFLGCGYTHQEQVHVSDYPEVAIEIVNGDICDGPPLTLSVSSNQTISYIDWEEGTDSILHQVNDSGWQFVRLSNGHCESTDSIFIDFAIDNLNDVLILPADTSICMEQIPFLLIPHSSYTTTFMLNQEIDTEFPLNNSGIYDIQVQLGDCVYRDSFELLVREECPGIFIPNVFSPNGDNVNDTFHPYGHGFELLEMSIYNRWGGLMFHGKGSDLVWTGEYMGQKNQPGIYVYKMIILNSKDQTVGEYRGDVLLLR